MVTIINNVKLLKESENDFFNSIFLETKNMLESELAKNECEGIIIIDGTPFNYSFKIKSKDESSAITLESIINKLFD
ncbi:hypothetical protein [Flavobacterium sp. NRK F7]|uniref:hypothetical protein n=1 Tax=Flavobacterium sp. NRK F7 TaxID=2954930 RepID=UPI0020913A10|nr:hypothetical protein [Flavobacterium sp. NRK F7]MCO6161507.1 hypothetical protein [Flavobacterium sp. NRK F7]